ncbi:hypothetical protein [Falsiroseomonas sp. HW251]|uniref:hypothetical protein n=1 Tax=Falsiroseomonas sp. HW251 TaxID=3390998 RepID=UPI003D323846
MPRLALGLVVVGLLAVLLTVLLVMGEATLPGRLPPLVAALLAGVGGVSLVTGLSLLEPRGADASQATKRAIG